jgi:ABC-2 type transport system ATP-binding protein
MPRHVLEIEAEPLVSAMEALNAQGIEATVFGSLLHATVQDAEAAIPLIRKIAADSNIAVQRIDRIVPSLEDVFVTLIETA